MIHLLSSFLLELITLDDGYIAEMFRKQLSSLAMHPKISHFHCEESLKYNHNLKERAKITVLCTFHIAINF